MRFIDIAGTLVLPGVISHTKLHLLACQATSFTYMMRQRDSKDSERTVRQRRALDAGKSKLHQQRLGRTRRPVDMRLAGTRMYAACTASLRRLHSAHNQLTPAPGQPTTPAAAHPTSAATRLKRALSQLTAPVPRTATPTSTDTLSKARAASSLFLQQEPHSYPYLGNDNV